MEAKISQLQKTLKQKDELIRRIQGELLKKYTTRETWVPIDGIIDKFQDLRYDIRQWCSGEAKKVYKFDLKGNEREVFLQEVAKFLLLEGADQKEFPKGLLRDGNLRTRVILEGLFAHHLFSTFFSDPFFFLGQQISKGLNDILSLAASWSLREAHSWRAETLRLIFPQRTDLDATTVKAQVEKLIHKAAIIAAKEFARSPARHIIDEKSGTFKRLEDVYIQAAELSYRLGTQKQYMKLSTGSVFLSRPFRKAGDGRTNERLHGDHRKMNIHHSCEDDGEENQPISMVVYPLIEAFGSAPTGPGDIWKYFHEPRIWSKLEVRLDIPEPGEPAEDETKKVKSTAVSRRVDSSKFEPAERLGARLLKGLESTTLLELVKPYIDEFSNKLKPLVDGLREETMQLEEKCDEKDLSIRSWQARTEDIQKERDQLRIQKEAMSLEIKRLGSELRLKDI
ncbi:hypothetical protein EAF04_007360 [Stromatinia cepivora]|nr:hypothetical protein EAF04_007360 [Stromatinia cepivora]